jgi:hypothetical protein
VLEKDGEDQLGTPLEGNEVLHRSKEERNIPHTMKE